MTAKACSKPGSSTANRHMQKQDFGQNAHYFQGLSWLENIAVWEKDWVTVKVKWNAILQYPHVLPSAETDAEHGALGPWQAVAKPHDHLHLMLSSHRKEAHSHETKIFHLGLGKVKNNLSSHTGLNSSKRKVWFQAQHSGKSLGRKRTKCICYASLQ